LRCLRPEQLKLSLQSIGTYAEYKKYLEIMQLEYANRRQFEQLSALKKTNFKITGKCYVCRANVQFYVDLPVTSSIDDKLTPNWREQLVCPYCRLPNRMRAAIHIFESVLLPLPSSSIYITEQVTFLFRILREKFCNLEGSEYLGSTIPFGNSNHKGVRNENITALSFSSDHFDYVLSFDVLEHVPDYIQGLRELLRVLKPGGSILLSVPLTTNSSLSITRAEICVDGSIKYILPPEYHGDPLVADGCLCFHNFGWDLLEQMRNVGYQDVRAFFYWSPEFGYFGKGEQLVLMARKHG
jgi:SAM-dependent methyltransferase